MNIGPLSANVANNRFGRMHSRKWSAAVVLNTLQQLTLPQSQFCTCKFSDAECLFFCGNPTPTVGLTV